MPAARSTSSTCAARMYARTASVTMSDASPCCFSQSATSSGTLTRSSALIPQIVPKTAGARSPAALTATSWMLAAPEGVPASKMSAAAGGPAVSRRRRAGVGSRPDHVDHVRHGLVERYPVALRTVPVAERHGAARDVGVTRDRHERDLLLLRRADLLLHPLVGLVDLGPDPGRPQPRHEIVQVGRVVVADRDADRLDRREPGRERPGVVLGEHAEEPLDRPEQRPVDHDGPLARPVGRLVLQLEQLRQVEVDLDRRHLPGAPDGVLGLYRDLRAVEG